MKDSNDTLNINQKILTYDVTKKKRPYCQYNSLVLSTPCWPFVQIKKESDKSEYNTRSRVGSGVNLLLGPVRVIDKSKESLFLFGRPVRSDDLVRGKSLLIQVRFHFYFYSQMWKEGVDPGEYLFRGCHPLPLEERKRCTVKKERKGLGLL